MNAPAEHPHPHWCDHSRCHAATGGPHECEPVRVASPGHGPRLLMLLWQKPGGPIRLRIVAIGSMLVNEVDVDLDTAHLTAATITKLLALSAPPE